MDGTTDITLAEAQESAISEPASGPVAPVNAGSASAGTEGKSAYPSPAAVPTQEGPEGIRFDFNHGARVLLPSRASGKWRVRLRDVDTGNILFQSENQGALVRSAKR